MIIAVKGNESQMKNKVFTFWEGYRPHYIDLCMYSWDFPHAELCYANLNQFTDISKGQLEQLKSFTLPQVADFVRVHVLRDNGGYWLDADTIITGDRLPDANMIGDPVARTTSIGYLHIEPYSDMFVQWARYQDEIVKNPLNSGYWNCFGNAFADSYVYDHGRITIADIKPSYPETYMITGTVSRREKYRRFYFESNYKLSDLQPTNMIMLHNSWTPDDYKHMTVKEILADNRTLSNILKERYYDIDY